MGRERGRGRGRGRRRERERGRGGGGRGGGRETVEERGEQEGNYRQETPECRGYLAGEVEYLLLCFLLSSALHYFRISNRTICYLTILDV